MTLATKPKDLIVQKKRKPTKVEFQFGLEQLKEHYPDAHCSLDYKNPFELVVATILSAQCTDDRVNIVTKTLFKKLPDVYSFAKVAVIELEQLIRSTGFYRNKAKNIKECSQILVQKYGGKVPQTMEQLYELPGIGRKTANVVLGNAFSISSGVAVDTHVTRVCYRLGWVKTDDAVKIEIFLNKTFRQEEWIKLSHYLIAHGRTICSARSPKCNQCFFQITCPRRGV